MYVLLHGQDRIILPNSVQLLTARFQTASRCSSPPSRLWLSLQLPSLHSALLLTPAVRQGLFGPTRTTATASSNALLAAFPSARLAAPERHTTLGLGSVIMRRRFGPATAMVLWAMTSRRRAMGINGRTMAMASQRVMVRKERRTARASRQRATVRERRNTAVASRSTVKEVISFA